MLDFIKSTVQAVKNNTDYLTKKATSSPTSDSMAHRLEDVQTQNDTFTSNQFAYLTNEFKTYPANADFKSVGINDAANTLLANWVELVPVNTITSDFYIYGLITCPSNTNLITHRIVLGTGTAGNEVAKISVKSYAVTANLPTVFIFPKALKVAANTRVALNSMTSAAGQAAHSIVCAMLYWEGTLATT